MAELDSFALNIQGVTDLIENNVNKVSSNGDDEGATGEPEDYLELPMADDELLELKRQWVNKSDKYYPEIKTRQNRNKVYYLGRQQQGTSQRPIPVSSNLIFQSEETFIPQALAKNPEPVVWSDNTDIGKQASGDIKTMLQFHADILCLRKKLGVMVRHWSIYFVGIVKHGWNIKTNDISTEIRKPQNFILDPDGYIDEYGDFIGAFLGEKIDSTAKDLIALYPKHKEYITEKANQKLGTTVTRTEWWTNDYCFTTFEDKILDKHKNEFFNYDKEENTTDEFGIESQTVTPAVNHFAQPKMPYTFLSVFSLQEHPYDDTNLIEQSIPSQDRITARDYQIDKNLRVSNNSLLISTNAGNIETAKQMANGIEDGDPILVDGPIGDNVQRLPASALPNGILDSQQVDKETLLSIFGVNGLTAQAPDENTTARGMILNQQHDSTRIGGGVGDALEQVADNIFNWWVQLYYVFYDEPHYAAIMGNGEAVNYVQLVMTDTNRQFVVSVTPDSMKPKDETSEINLAIQLADSGWLDPINFFKELNYADPLETAKMVTMWKISPQQYYATFFPQEAAQQQPQMGAPPGTPAGQVPTQPGSPDQSLASPPASSSLAQVPINAGVAQPK